MAGEDTGRWRLFCRLESPIHSACAQADINAVKELWEGAGQDFIFERRQLERNINIPLHMPGESCSGWPALVFACLPPQDKWPPVYPDLFQPKAENQGAADNKKVSGSCPETCLSFLRCDRGSCVFRLISQSARSRASSQV